MSEQSEVSPATEVTVADEQVAAPDAPPEAAAGADLAAPEEAGTEEAATEEGRPDQRKVREGLVVSTKMDKTAVVAIVERVRHPRYVKTVQRTKRLYAHDPDSEVRVGDRVRLSETRPLSKLKRWRIVEVLERAK
jgi:small subunit ribosomal protein S17